MKPSTQSLFIQEMHEQVAAAEANVLDAEHDNDPLLVQAARNHLDGLVALARRNGLTITPNVPTEREVVIPSTDVGDSDLLPGIAPAPAV